MYKRKNPMDYSDCSIRIPVDIISGSWKIWLILEINKGVARPSELYHSIAIAPRRVLTKQLKELELQGVVGKTVYPVLPLRVEYYLTAAGKDLIPILEQLERWGDKHKSAFINVIEDSE
ncbi:helix-turn-helix transcriptional regulator [Dysgonomonas sp. HDW5B]|uniref:winged helix-turn-helix transcriptional regulator n=1 Tax=Dysgonomonas sp. HDW5B TaxID=2714927 RepID=UPI00140DE74F|nr:helix-turn-helix domain-containing protein [Dysgonomonas sp. HDW5B]QIK55301.1 helix-turn-helix transcriptional regulator [Dysgonomonas sp. HDW5B]